MRSTFEPKYNLLYRFVPILHDVHLYWAVCVCTHTLIRVTITYVYYVQEISCNGLKIKISFTYKLDFLSFPFS